MADAKTLARRTRRPRPRGFDTTHARPYDKVGCRRWRRAGETRMIGRRTLIVASAAGLCTVPSRAGAQAAQIPVIGFLNSASAELYQFNVEAFKQGLAEAGFVADRNVHIDFRWAHGDYGRLPALAAELV